MGTLKASLKTTMSINNTEFGILMSAVTLVNTILPLFAGAFVDDTSSRLGSVRSTALVSATIFIGSIIVSLAAAQGNYPAMVTGQIIYGLGGGMIVTMQEAIISKWFRNQQLSIVLGVTLAWSRLVQWVAKMICYPIIRSTANPHAPIFIATMICAVGFLTNGVYWYLMYRCGSITGTGQVILVDQHRPLPVYTSMWTMMRWVFRWIVYLPSIFWMVPWLQLVMSSVLSSFDDVATEFIEFRFATDEVMAGYQSSLSQAMPIVLAPVLGILIHRYGKRLYCLIFGACLLVLSMLLLGYTMASPVIGMLIFSSALSFGPIAIISSGPLMLPHELSGLAMGLHKCANNIGTTIVSVLVGYVQDLTYHDGDTNDDQHDLMFEYESVMILYLVLACMSVAVAVMFWWMDRTMLDGWLQADKHERDHRLAGLEKHDTPAPHTPEDPPQEVEKTPACVSTVDTDHVPTTAHNEDDDETHLRQITGNRLRSSSSWVYAGLYTFWLVAAWVVFIVFALMPLYMNYDQNFSG
ncbi:MFS general substrate transporter [Hesseltinella vesiculosa]|uniref:Lysosomal dipeptide transporter MFSD1 n=1 Tax=Hesseltinella vesiculosa TaxID=101127 RepID=A0A1X2GQG0_9FUNG|nr:MFS general substrate transporter [Hesseltinella vesiculosa]